MTMHRAQLSQQEKQLDTLLSELALYERSLIAAQAELTIPAITPEAQAEATLAIQAYEVFIRKIAVKVNQLTTTLRDQVETAHIDKRATLQPTTTGLPTSEDYRRIDRIFGDDARQAAPNNQAFQHELDTVKKRYVLVLTKKHLSDYAQRLGIDRDRLNTRLRERSLKRPQRDELERRRNQLTNRIDYFERMIAQIDDTLANLSEQSQLPQDQQGAFAEYLTQLNLANTVDALAKEQTECVLLNDPTYRQFLQYQQTAKEACDRLLENPLNVGEDAAVDPTYIDAIRQQARTLGLNLTTLRENAPYFSQDHRASQIEQVTSELTSRVPSFNPYQDTFTGQQNGQIPAPLNDTYNELEAHLDKFKTTLSRIEQLLSDVTNPVLPLSKAGIENKLKQIGGLYKELRLTGDQYNNFLYDHASAVHGWLRRYDSLGQSKLSDITQQKLDELATFNEHIIKELGIKLRKVFKLHESEYFKNAKKPFAPGTSPGMPGGDPGVVRTFFEWPFILIAAVRNAYANRDNKVIVGGSDGNRVHGLHSDPEFAASFGDEIQGVYLTSHTSWLLRGYGFDKTPLTDEKKGAPKASGNKIVLPLFGAKVAQDAKPEDHQKAAGFSVVAVAKEVFGLRWQDHVTPRNGGLFVTWDNAQQGEKFLEAIKTKNREYLAWKKDQNAIDASINLPQGNDAIDLTTTQPSTSGPTTSTSTSQSRASWTNPTRHQPPTPDHCGEPERHQGTRVSVRAH